MGKSTVLNADFYIASQINLYVISLQVSTITIIKGRHFLCCHSPSDQLRGCWNLQVSMQLHVLPCVSHNSTPRRRDRTCSLLLQSVQSSCGFASQAVLQEAWCGCIHDVDSAIQGSCKAHYDTYTQHQSSVAAVNAHFMPPRKLQHIFKHLYIERQTCCCLELGIVCASFSTSFSTCTSTDKHVGNQD